MYFSLNKKIFYTVFVLFIFMAVLFLSMFLSIYSKKYMEDRNTVFLRNQYVLELLYENIALRREISEDKINLSEASKEAISGDLGQKQEELSREQKLSQDLQQNYNERTIAFIEGAKIIGISSVLSLISIIILGFLLQRWVVAPIRRLTDASKMVAQGDFSHRIPLGKKQIFFDEFDTLAKAFNMMLDNIESKMTEIKNTEVFLQSLIDAIPDGIRVIDHDYNVVLTNKAYLGQTEKQKAQGLGKCFYAYNLDKPCSDRSFRCPLREIRDIKSKSINIIQSIGGHPLSISAAPLRIKKGSDNKDFYIIESIRDLSDDIRFSHEQKVASLGFLATSVAHEIKNNLGSVRMILEGLLEKYFKDMDDKSQEKQYLEMIYNQIVTSINIPERLLKLAHYSGEEQEVFDVKESINEVLSLLDYEAKRNGIEVERNYCNSATCILGSEADFEMIILNLSQNALKAMPSGGKLELDVKKDKNTVIVEVKDSGIGIAEDKMEHIFEPFYSDGRSSRHQGTGLGLAIVKSLVEKFKGSIAVKSEVNKGTSFTIKFPKSQRNKLQN